MKILCNLPLESFEDRSEYTDVEIVTYGPAERMRVDDRFYPYDIEFDPSSQTVHELLALMPQGFVPDVLLIYWPDQEPIPIRLEESPVRVVGVISDYNLTLPFLTGLWPFFDTILVDRSGVELFEKLSFADSRYFCQYTFKRRSHRLYPEVAKDVDIAFIGNLNPIVQRERIPWLHRVGQLAEKGLRVVIEQGMWGEEYGRLIAGAHLGFNRSIRGEMNLRAFEVPACGTTLLMESSNREVREFLIPDEEVVLYDEENFEDIVLGLLADPKRCARIAAAGHRRIQEYRMGKRLSAMAELLRQPGPARLSSTGLDQALGRSAAVLATWGARTPSVTADLTRACDLAPDDPRPLNLLAIALTMSDIDAHAQRVFSLLKRACAMSPSYVPAAVNLTILAQSAGYDSIESIRADTIRRLMAEPRWNDLDGIMLPIGFSANSVAMSLGLAEALRANDRSIYVRAILKTIEPELSHTTS